jgi:hypothetical protein
LVAVTIIFAGCAGNPGAPAASSVAPAPVARPAEFSDTTGAIEGLVHSEELVPIVAANVSIAALGLSTQTDAEGRFTFSHIAPGDQLVSVKKTGYGGTQTVRRIEAGRVTTVDILLSSAAIVEAYHTTAILTGTLGCSVGLSGVVGILVSACGDLGLFENKNPLHWRVPGRLVDWKGAVLESEWQSTQALGRSLAMFWDATDCQATISTEALGAATGLSPLRSRVNATDVDFFLHGKHPNRSCDDLRKVCNDDIGCPLDSTAFAFAEQPGGRQNVTAYIQQRFTNYATFFFVFEPPVDFTARPDA